MFEEGKVAEGDEGTCQLVMPLVQPLCTLSWAKVVLHWDKTEQVLPAPTESRRHPAANESTMVRGWIGGDIERWPKGECGWKCYFGSCKEKCTGRDYLSGGRATP